MNIDAQGSNYEKKTPKWRTCLKKVEEIPEAAQKKTGSLPCNWEGEMKRTRRLFNVFNPAKLRLFFIL